MQSYDLTRGYQSQHLVSGNRPYLVTIGTKRMRSLRPVTVVVGSVNRLRVQFGALGPTFFTVPYETISMTMYAGDAFTVESWDSGWSDINVSVLDNEATIEVERLEDNAVA